MPITQQSDGKWKLTSPKSGKNLGVFDTKAEAEQHAGAVAYFAEKSAGGAPGGKKRLTNLRLSFLSGVDNPANQESAVLLLKRADVAKAPVDYATFSAAQMKDGKTPEEAAAAWRKLPADQKKRAQPDVGDVHIHTATGAVLAGAAKVGKFARVIAKIRGETPPAFRALVKDAVTFDDVIDGRETAALIDALTSTLWDICDDDDTPQDAKRPLIVAALQDFYAALAASDSASADNPLAKEQDMTPEETQALVDKAVAKAIPAAVEPLKSDLAKADVEKAALLERLAKSEATVELLRKADARRTLVAKAAAVIKESGAVANAEDVADLMEGTSEAHQEKILAMVKQNGALAAEGQIFKALGIGGAETPVGAEGQVEKLALEKRTANPKLSLEAARAAVFDEHPELYDEIVGAAADGDTGTD